MVLFPLHFSVYFSYVCGHGQELAISYKVKRWPWNWVRYWVCYWDRDLRRWQDLKTQLLPANYVRSRSNLLSVICSFSI